MQDDKVKLKLLVEMVKALNERVKYLSKDSGMDWTRAKELDKKVKDIEDQIE